VALSYTKNKVGFKAFAMLGERRWPESLKAKHQAW